MAVPGFQAITLPLLSLAADGEEHALKDAVDALAQQFGLSEADRSALLPSGRQPVFDNRVGWAKVYLKKAGLLEAPRRGMFRITAVGRDLLKTRPERIDISVLERYPEFQKFRELRHEKDDEATPAPSNSEGSTPEESLEDAYTRMRANLESELIERVKGSSARFFEHLVVELLVKLGYGGNRRDAGRAIGQSGDGGVDGIIKDDRLGLDMIYVQAKSGIRQSGGRKFRSLRERCKDIMPRRECLSRPLNSPRRRSSTLSKSRARSF